MNLQVLVALAEIVSALAVTLTLIALIVTIRQNTRSQKALAVDSIAAAITSINVPAMASPALGAAISKATTDWASAGREERIMAHYFRSEERRVGKECRSGMCGYRRNNEMKVR